jgi:Zn finger protein HypA/HybF involved in hydrogenase expression
VAQSNHHFEVNQMQTAINIEAEQSVEMAGDKLRFERSCGEWCSCPDCEGKLEEEAWRYGV